MITAKCDNCGKDLGVVNLVAIIELDGTRRVAVSKSRNFKLGMRSIGGYRIACSIKCAEELNAAPDVKGASGTNVFPDGRGGFISPEEN